MFAVKFIFCFVFSIVRQIIYIGLCAVAAAIFPLALLPLVLVIALFQGVGAALDPD